MSTPLSPRAFLWDNKEDAPDENSFSPASGVWWEQYYGGLVRGGCLSEVALREVTRSSRDIAGLIPKLGSWNRPRPFKGVVIGAVQSGKTQSMMGLAATALDNGFRVVIVLAGLKDDLRTQTARRFNSDLLLQSDPVPGIQGATTLGKPRGSTGSARGYAPPFHVDCHEYAPLGAEMARALSAGKPCVVVVKKLPVSLGDLSMVMTDLYADFGAENLPTLILDDECDEATVPGGEHEKAVPEAIMSIWNRATSIPPVAYVGYTATAAANLLQHPDWTLYPHWTYLLRYPGDKDDAIQFAEPASDNWYSGGECYYFDFGDEPDETDNFLSSTIIDQSDLSGPVIDNPSLMEAFRAFFVSGACRMALNPDLSFDDLSRLPAPHSMMIHTSAVQDDHSRWARGIRAAFGGDIEGDASVFNPEVLMKICLGDEERWKNWFSRFYRSRERIYEIRPHIGTQRNLDWEQVKSYLPIVFENTRLKVVNSDDDSGTLDYKVALNAAGKPAKRPDTFLVAVGGSRLSRGITVEGLCVSYFARTANVRHDDTVLQMSRWFGYRGPYLEFCRLFTTPAAFVGLREIAENDIQLRLQIARLMEEKKSPRDATLIFRASPYALPTAKIGAGQIRDLSFSPVNRVLSTLECGSLAAKNQEFAEELVKRIRERKCETVTRQGGLTRGLLSRNWTLSEIAEVLDAWAFEKHNPSSEQNLLSQFYRPRDLSRPSSVLLESRRDPYQIAAYFRYWIKWAEDNEASVPAFNVGVAMGEMTEETQPFDLPLLNRIVTPENEVVGGWTGAASNWRGDVIFDNPPPALLDSRKGRLAASPGLLLLYVVHKDATGKAGKGRKRQFHSPFFGISVPAGGPDFVRVLTDTQGPLVQH